MSRHNHIPKMETTVFCLVCSKERGNFFPKIFPSPSLLPADFLSVFGQNRVVFLHLLIAREWWWPFNQAPLEWGMRSVTELHGDFGEGRHLNNICVLLRRKKRGRMLGRWSTVPAMSLPATSSCIDKAWTVESSRSGFKPWINLGLSRWPWSNYSTLTRVFIFKEDITILKFFEIIKWE